MFTRLFSTCLSNILNSLEVSYLLDNLFIDRVATATDIIIIMCKDNPTLACK